MLQFTEKYRQYLAKFTDIRFIGQVVFVVIVLLISWSGVKVIHTNYQLQRQISQLQQQNAIQKLQNENDDLKNAYYKSPQYLELSARQNFGLAAPGEKELLVPKAVALAHVPAVSETGAAEESKTAITGPFYKRNMQAWFNFFLHRSNPVN
jgi:cell division protein FtsB